MTAPLREALTAALDDEYKARATYRAILARHGEVRPFTNIVESEERHIQALERLFQRYRIPVPPDPWPGRVEAPESLLEACRAGVAGERENAALYERLIRAVADHPDVQETFRRLLAASQENHLPAFERCVGREEREEGGGGAGGRGRGGCGEGGGGGRGARGSGGGCGGPRRRRRRGGR